MKQGFLEQESKRANKRNKKIYFILLFVYVFLMAIISFALKDSIDLSDYTSRKLVVCFFILTGIMLISMVLGLFLSGRAAADGSKSLLLPFKENTKEAVGKIIDQEILEEKIQVDEYIDTFPEGKKPYGERIILIPSYLLIFNGMGRITAIPRDKIYWICAQVGQKGYSFIVRLLIFTEKRTFYVDGADIEHVEKIADKLYQYIPNIFSEYDPFRLSYKLDKLFDKNREEFMKFYESEKKKHDAS